MSITFVYLFGGFSCSSACLMCSCACTTVPVWRVEDSLEELHLMGSRDCTPDDRCRSWQQVPWPAKPSFQPRNFPVQFSSLKTVGAGLWLVTHYRNTWLLGTRTLDAVKTKMSKELGGSEGFYWKLQIKKCIFVPFLALCFGFFVFVFLLNYLETVLTRKLTRHISSLCFFKWCLFI